MNIIVATEHELFTLSTEPTDPNTIGQKGVGLFKIPRLWSLPFLCISASVFEHYSNAENHERTQIVTAVANNIRSNLCALQISVHDRIIIRSSGVSEGMEERGLFDSSDCFPKDIELTLIRLFNSIIEHETPLPRIAFVIQQYIQAKVIGHLSNERRFSEAKRDWLYEYRTCSQNEIETGRIAIRSWREPPKDTTNLELSCTSPKDIQHCLKRVASYYTPLSIAIHFEFIWDGERVYLVQADIEKTNSSCLENPSTVDVTVHNPPSSVQLSCLRVANEADSRFSKIANHLLYKSAGLKTVPLYILEGDPFIKPLKNGIISQELESDIKALVNNSIVIRTDIATSDQAKRQMLDRSNEIRTYEDAKNWLLDQGKKLTATEDIAFLFHIFVPAKASAFVSASPINRIVKVDALWGLPEGLYYNACDRITVDTKTVNTDFLDAKCVDIKKKQRVYKGSYIAPNSAGTWVEKHPVPPYDWKLCVDDDAIRQISVESRKIASITKKDVNVMWFIGIDKDYYKTANLAWYHEENSENTHTTSHYKKKYFFEDELIIRNSEDLTRFINDHSIKEVKLQLTDDTLLRDKEFLKKLGQVAVDRNATIILEGTILAHPLYQLSRTGARVLTPEAQSSYEEDAVYNKLVRDKIPEIILSNGELATYYRLSPEAHLRALIEKAVEEAYEIMSASPESFEGELADEYEVITSVKKQISAIRNTSSQQKIKRSYAGLVSQSNLLCSCSIDLCTNNGEQFVNSRSMGRIGINTTYESTQLQVELHFHHDAKSSTPVKGADKLVLMTEDDNKRSILKNAFRLSDAISEDEVTTCCDNILSCISKFYPGNKIEDLLQQVAQKKIKRGGFDEGYMLYSSTLSDTKGTSGQQELYHQATGCSGIMHFLEYPAGKNADYLNKGKGELLLRMSLPVCFNECQFLFDSYSTKKYIGANNQMIVCLRRTASIVSVSIYLKAENQITSNVQLSFDDLP
jgi:predicted house-cleaning noncanonical NTP pyrophosphatase (MazG superfamily)